MIIPHLCSELFREAARRRKNIFLMAVPLRGGGLPLRKKNFCGDFFYLLKNAIKLEGGGGKALIAFPLRIDFIFSASLSNTKI